MKIVNFESFSVIKEEPGSTTVSPSGMSPPLGVVSNMVGSPFVDNGKRIY